MKPSELAELYSQIESEKRKRHVAHVVADHLVAEQVADVGKRKPRSVAGRVGKRSVLLVALCALAMPAAVRGQGSWLHPTDAQYQEAIKTGSSDKPKAKYKAVRFGDIQIPEETSNIEAVPPLTCADRMAARAYAALEPAPTLDDVKLACDGMLHLNFLYYSQALNDNWPIVLEHAGETLRAKQSIYDQNPEVSSYHVLFGSAVGYMYIETYLFALPAAWTDDATILYADYGRHRKLKLDCSKLAKEWSGH